MKLVHNLVFALTIGIFAVLGVMAGLLRQHEAKLMEQNDREDLSSTGRALRPAFVKTWLKDGRESALELLEYTDAHTQDVAIRWVPLDASTPLQRGPAPTADLRPVLRGKEVFAVDD